MFAGASLDENSGAFCELKANFFRLILTKADLFNFYTQDQLGVDLKSSGSALALSDTAVHYEGFYKNNFVQSQRNAELEKGFGIFFADNGARKIKCIDSQEAGR